MLRVKNELNRWLRSLGRDGERLMVDKTNSCEMLEDAEGEEG